ncbi:MAG TPA: hypothetical protein VIN75_26865 [Burkholderiaceae bacterium]
MTDLPHPDVLEAVAAEIILEHARDVEFMSINEMTAEDERFAGLDEDQRDEACRIISELIPRANVTIDWGDASELERLRTLTDVATFTRLVFADGDKVLARLKRDDWATPEQMERIAEHLAVAFDGYPCIVVPPGIEIEPGPDPAAGLQAAQDASQWHAERLGGGSASHLPFEGELGPQKGSGDVKPRPRHPLRTDEGFGHHLACPWHPDRAGIYATSLGALCRDCWASNFPDAAAGVFAQGTDERTSAARASDVGVTDAASFTDLAAVAARRELLPPPCGHGAMWLIPSGPGVVCGPQPPIAPEDEGIATADGCGLPETNCACG